MASARCGICHQGAPPSLNPFGASIQNGLREAAASELTESVIARLAAVDSDGDGVSNDRELAAGTLPGDRASKPGADSAPPRSPIDRMMPPHSFHPLVVHFPVALLLFGALLEAGGARFRRPDLRSAGFLNISAAALFSVFAVATGIAALLRQSMPLSGIPLFHLCTGSTASIAMILVASRGIVENRRGSGRTSRVYWGLLAFAFLAVACAGHLGSVLVFG